MTNLLAEIVAHKRAEIAALDAAALRRAAASAPRPRDLLAALAPRGPGGRPAVIAELKRASPSKGLLAPKLDLLRAAQVYAGSGAAAISVVTDQRFFMGELETLQALRFERHIALPLLRKDFILAESQVYQSRACGADAVLLIVAAVADDAQLGALHALSVALGLAALVEVHDEREVQRALKLPGIRLIGINNRDLTSFAVSLETTQRLRPGIPPGILVVSESGIRTAADVERVAKSGVDAVLVGEALVRAPNMAAKLRELAGWSQEGAHA